MISYPAAARITTRPVAEARRHSGGGRMDAATAYATLRTALAAFERPPAELDEAELAEVGAIVARELAIEDAVLGSDRARDVTVADTEIAAAVRELQDRYPARKDFTLDLARHGLDVRGLRQALGRELKVAAVLEQVGQEAPVASDDEVLAYYEANRARFAYPETREARHILVTVNDAYPENSRVAALDRIGRIRRELGEDSSQWAARFGEQAARCSECPTAMEEGRLGRARPGQLYPELDAALFAMGEGEIAGPVETEVGFHILYCERIHAAGELSFEAAAPKIRERLQQAQARRRQRAWLAGICSGKPE